MAHGLIWHPRHMLKRAQRPRLMYHRLQIKQWRAHILCRVRWLFPPRRYRPQNKEGMPATMKKLILFLFMLIIMPVQSAQIANIDYIHTAIADKWNITIPYNREITNVGVAANMKYLLTAIDVANEILNREKTTDYGNGEFATMVAADTVATDTAVETLVRKNEKYVFEFDSRYADSSTVLRIGAAGTFYVDWGGIEQVIEKKDTAYTTYKCPKSSGASCEHVRFGGRATAYDPEAPTIQTDCLSYDMSITHMDGCLGCIFPTLPDGTQPRFWSTFKDCRDLKNIPENLFAGVTGVGYGTFHETFAGTPITTIPENLFAGLDIDEPLATEAFGLTFRGCSELTGPSARINGKYLYEIWPDATRDQVAGMYSGATGLDDYDNIPDVWK